MKRQYLRHYSKYLTMALQVIDTFGEIVRQIFSLFSPFWRQWKSFSEPRKILVITPRPIGDTIMTIPAIKSLKTQFPSACLTALAEPSVTPLLERLQLFNQIVLFHPPHFRYDERVKIPTLLRLFYTAIYHFRCLWSFLKKALELRSKSFDLAIDFDGDPRRALLMALAGIPVRVGVANGGGAFLLTHPIDLSDDQHELDRRIQICKSIGIKSIESDVFLSWTQEDEASLEEKLKQNQIDDRDRLIVICPFAGFPSKEWKSLNWAKVVDCLSRIDGVKIVICGAPNERKKSDAIKSLLRSQMQHKILDFTGYLSLPELIVLIHRCDLMICVDSGPMHIATSLKKPMVILWSMQAPPRRFGPIYSDSDGEYVLLHKEVPCANCRLFYCPKSVSCMDMIEPEEVIDAATKMLQEITTAKQQDKM